MSLVRIARTGDKLTITNGDNHIATVAVERVGQCRVRLVIDCAYPQVVVRHEQASRSPKQQDAAA